MIAQTLPRTISATSTSHVTHALLRYGVAAGPLLLYLLSSSSRARATTSDVIRSACSRSATWVGSSKRYEFHLHYDIYFRKPVSCQRSAVSRHHVAAEC
jgi:hypothetical protein